MRKTRPTPAEVANGIPVSHNHNYVFIHNGQRSYRTYEIICMSPIDRSKTFKIRIAASSIRELFKHCVYALGNLRATHIMEDFTLHFMAISKKPGMAEEIVHIPLAEELDVDRRPTTDEPVEPIMVED